MLTRSSVLAEAPHIFLLSNGNGEDWVGVQVALALKKQFPVHLSALPLVGEGELYQREQIPVVGGRWLPSGGFTFKHFPALWQDLQGGLVTHGWHMTQRALNLKQQVSLTLAVGDILPLALAWGLKRPYIFLGCTKSDYYSPGRSCYFWPEQRLMRTRRCLHSFARDPQTAHRLQQSGVPASYLGNPMMDGLPEVGPLVPTGVGLLPGSRPQEAQANFLCLLTCARAMTGTEFMAALAPGLPLASFVEPALSQGWQWQEPYLVQGQTKVWLRTGAFGQVLQESRLFFAMAGTATEQAVGLGRPVVTIPGAGPQFTARFAQLQEQLLGESVLLCQTPQQAAQVAQQVLADPQRLARIQANGLTRMGQPGAAQDIARFIQQALVP
ncbi:lipid-A-disaccharide synthase-related protein [Candidatus Cyanaurora vandensis]|uniref:lipid-A-disaccharide synthase-related protein n=1 Tax=Candidatus Cyanaurora vandensis TaxID=2714958 RepID=UPI00257B28AB|nr:lipid-A-disaccharide synthase-related protein [Candidatus Cyanaurora vandensis]